MGNDAPESENCELLLAADDTVTLPPVAVTVETPVVVEPMSTLPKLSVEGVIVSEPEVVEPPLPLRGMLRPEPGTKILPLSDPDDAGANVTVRVMICPLLKNSRSFGPLTEKPLPVDWNAVTVSGIVPELVKTRDCVELLPTWTDPNETLEGAAVIGLLPTANP